MDLTREKIHVIVDSKNRLDPVTETATNFTISFNNSIPVERIVEIEIESVQIPYSFYAINSNNNVLSIDGGTGVLDVTIAEGNYTASSLITELENEISTQAGQNVTITFSTQTYKYTFSTGGSFDILSIEDNTNSTLAPLIGFNTTTTIGASTTADSAINISGPNYLIIESEFLTKYVQNRVLYSDISYSNVFWSIPLQVSPGDVLINTPGFSARLNRKISISQDDIIDFQLKDDNKNLIDLNGLEWSIQLKLYTE
jgi:hypothetical protein